MTAQDQHVVRLGAGHQRAGVTALAAAVLATLAVLILAAPAAAQPSPAPVHCRLGAYLTALHDFDYANHTFAADFWLWSVCPAATPQPLETMEFINANSITVYLPSTQTTAEGVWSQRKIRGIFRYPWNLTAYPFDRHTLPIVLEEGVADTRTLVYDADTANTGLGPALAPPEWRVTGVALAAGSVTYDTTFGDPTLAPGGRSTYARLTLTITLARHDLTSFVKLTFVVYIAFLVSLISYFLNMQSPTLLTARLGVISGALFAVAVNLRTVTTSLASEDRLTLVDQVHAVALVALLVDAVAALVTQLLIERGRSAAAVTRFDRIVMIVVVVSFVAVNVWLVGRAVA
jgi:hypothetical protein